MEDEKVCINDDATVSEEKTPKKNIRDCLYKNIDVSVDSMDKFIVGAITLLIVALFMAIITR